MVFDEVVCRCIVLFFLDCPLSEYEIIQHVKCHHQMLKSVPDKRIRRAIQELVESSHVYPMGGHLYHAV